MEPKSYFKNWHIILVLFILCPILILNSAYKNGKRVENRLRKEKNSNFIELTMKRMLQESPAGNGNNMENQKTTINSNKVCSRSSKELNDYYLTGDLSLIDLSEEKIECENKEKDHMKALFAIVRKYTEDNDTIKEDVEEDIIKYGLHLLPFLIFLIFGILSALGWIACCICTCGDCFCCCCCKKSTCKKPCFIFTYLFYIIIIIVSINALIKSNKIFTSIADTECSILRSIQQFFEEDEQKQTNPKWIGISNVKNLLEKLKNITDLENNLKLNDFAVKKVELSNNKILFENETKKFDEEYYNEGNYHENYTTIFTDISLLTYQNKKYVLDIIENIGHIDSQNKYPNASFLYELDSNYSQLSKETDNYITMSEDSFMELKKNSSDRNNSIKDAEDIINDLEKTFDKINSKLGEKISDYSESINNYGKLSFKIIFIGLILINVVLAILLICICLCSMKPCTGCCLFRCLFKFCTHLLWNILALIMMISLIVGSLLSLSGEMGEDAVSLAYYVLSEENFKSDDPLLLNKLKDGKKYLNISFYYNGSLENIFEIGDSLDPIENLYEVLVKLENIIQEFNTLKGYSFSLFKEKIKNRTELVFSDFGLLEIPKQNSEIFLNETISLLNDEIKKTKTETWDIDGDKSLTCDYNSSEIVKFHPLSCKPINRDWIKSSNNTFIKDYAKIISTIIDLVKNLTTTSFINNVDSFEEKYKNVLDSYIEISEFLKNSISKILGPIKQESENEKIFSFLNIKFIGTNILIILKYLKYTLKHEFYNLGIHLIIIGISLIFSISSSILLIIIINIALKEFMEEKKNSDAKSEKEFLKSKTNKIKEKN